MKALRSHAKGGPETLSLDEVADPVPGPGDVLVVGARIEMRALWRELEHARGQRAQEGAVV